MTIDNIIASIKADFVQRLAAIPKTRANLLQAQTLREKAISLLMIADLTMDRETADTALREAWERAQIKA